MKRLFKNTPDISIRFVARGPETPQTELQLADFGLDTAKKALRLGPVSQEAMKALEANEVTFGVVDHNGSPHVAVYIRDFDTKLRIGNAMNVLKPKPGQTGVTLETEGTEIYIQDGKLSVPGILEWSLEEAEAKENDPTPPRDAIELLNLEMGGKCRSDGKGGIMVSKWVPGAQFVQDSPYDVYRYDPKMQMWVNGSDPREKWNSQKFLEFVQSRDIDPVLLEMNPPKVEQAPVVGGVEMLEVDRNTQLPESGAHYLTFFDSDFSPEQKNQLQQHHNDPVVRKWLDALTQDDVFLIGEIPDGPGDTRAQAWNYHDIAAEVNGSNGAFHLDTTFQQYLRAHGPDRPIRGVLYAKSAVPHLGVVSNEISEQYFGLQIQKKFGKKYEHYEEHLAVQLPNLAIDKVIFGAYGRDINQVQSAGWHTFIDDLNAFLTVDRSELANDLISLYGDADDDVLKGDENKILDNDKELKQFIADLLLEKIADLLGVHLSALPISVDYQSVDDPNTDGDADGVAEKLYFPYFKYQG